MRGIAREVRTTEGGEGKERHGEERGQERPVQQPAVSTFPAVSGRFARAMAGRRPPGQAPHRPLQQASIEDMRGVVRWEEEKTPLRVPMTLFLGIEDVIRLRDSLFSAVDTDDLVAIASILKRLSAMPGTRKLLERSGIGRPVGKLRKHKDAAISAQAKRLVAVWQRQIKGQPPSARRAVPPPQAAAAGSPSRGPERDDVKTSRREPS
ncbi:hypothetical protein AB1Y20_001562 [Prymnesium parvum]|uniref:TFIIS N-terminal domain-containing protein n=1 Tax=Prymnesium parvum TaxID=97485 RepID=A0AB34KB77_PRYPA